MNKVRRQRRPAAHLAVAIPGAQDRVPSKEIIAFIAGKVRVGKEDIRALKDKVAKRIHYAIHKQKILKPPVAGKLIFGDVIVWARGKREWRAAIDGLPANETLSGRALLPSLKSAGYITSAHPPQECAARLVAAYVRIAELESEVARLRQPARNWQERIIEKNIKSAKIKRGKRWPWGS
jgi:hypothetical protein